VETVATPKPDRRRSDIYPVITGGIIFMPYCSIPRRHPTAGEAAATQDPTRLVKMGMLQPPRDYMTVRDSSRRSRSRAGTDGRWYRCPRRGHETSFRVTRNSWSRSARGTYSVIEPRKRMTGMADDPVGMPQLVSGADCGSLQMQFDPTSGFLRYLRYGT